VSEKLAFQQRLGNGAAIQGDERPAAAIAEAVQLHGYQFLARARLALDANADIVRCDLTNQLEDLLHRRAAADHRAEAKVVRVLAASDGNALEPAHG